MLVFCGVYERVGEKEMTSCDAIIIGTGQAGPALGRRLASSGMKVAIIERGRFGGTCVEAAIGRYKRVIGDALRSRTPRRQATEVAIAANALNRMLEFGRPVSVRIG
jgi:pyruvate/2-oxoglutarate dehydrogenase complex dihydrolipoamide dehydrogenase (E3) component